ncbi:MAG TPA: hypothetical protein VFM27_09805 [Acidimicrobiales bacterium]|nr:hypothetical protein [Acidimicrobiales bacterium]
MDLRTALQSWTARSFTGAGATRNARRSLDEWSRAQDEVTALLERLGHASGPAPAHRTTSTAA